jgi:hypothetical protein
MDVNSAEPWWLAFNHRLLSAAEDGGNYSNPTDIRLDK